MSMATETFSDEDYTYYDVDFYDGELYRITFNHITRIYSCSCGRRWKATSRFGIDDNPCPCEHIRAVDEGK